MSSYTIIVFTAAAGRPIPKGCHVDFSPFPFRESKGKKRKVDKVGLIVNYSNCKVSAGLVNAVLVAMYATVIEVNNSVAKKAMLKICQSIGIL